MKLLVTVGQSMIEPIKSLPVDGVIVGFKPLSQRIKDPLKLNRDAMDTLKTFNDSNIPLYVSLNGIFHEPDLPNLEKFFSLIKEKNIMVEGLLFADLAVVECAENHGLKEHLIYYPETYVTNPQDTMFWHKENIKSVVLSREMTLENIKKIGTTSALPLTLFAHGYLNMFHSKRQLVKTFFDYTQENQTKDLSHQALHIKEELRDEFYPIIQDDHGTHIFREKPVSSLKYLDVLKPHIDALILDSLFYETDRFITIVNDYVRALKGEAVDETAYHDHDDGFYFKETVYQRERGKRGE